MTIPAADIDYNEVSVLFGRDGTVRDSDGNPLGRIDDDGAVRDRSGGPIGRIDGDGTVCDSDGSPLGRIDRDGAVWDKSGSIIGSARGMNPRWAAAYFFFDFFEGPLFS